MSESDPRHPEDIYRSLGIEWDPHPDNYLVRRTSLTDNPGGPTNGPWKGYGVGAVVRYERELWVIARSVYMMSRASIKSTTSVLAAGAYLRRVGSTVVERRLIDYAEFQVPSLLEQLAVAAL
jgi:hypothetical protein